MRSTQKGENGSAKQMKTMVNRKMDNIACDTVAAVINSLELVSCDP